MKCLEKVNLQRQGWGWEWVITTNTYKVSFGGDRTVLGGGYTTPAMY